LTTLAHINAVTSNVFLVAAGAQLTGDIFSISNGASIGFTGATIGSITAKNCASSGINNGAANVITTVVANQNSGNGITPGTRTTVGSLTANSNSSPGLSISEGCVIQSGSTTGNASSGISTTSAVGYINNFTINEATEVSNFTAFSNSRVYSQNHDNTAGNHQIFCDGGLINSNSSVRHTASGISWAMAPTSTNRSVTYPLNLSIAKIAVAASALVTVTVWMRRTNTGLTMTLMCKGGQIGGVAADVTASMAAAADTWEQLTITFTPNESGVVEILAQAYGGTTYTGYVDDMAVSQA
jgi:hypothetical protein